MPIGYRVDAATVNDNGALNARRIVNVKQFVNNSPLKINLDTMLLT